MKGDVAEPEGGHDRESPVNSRDPGVLLPFDVVHDPVETDGKERHSRHQQERIAYQSPEIWADVFRDKERQQLACEKLHRASLQIQVFLEKQPYRPSTILCAQKTTYPLLRRRLLGYSHLNHWQEKPQKGLPQPEDTIVETLVCEEFDDGWGDDSPDVK